MSIRGKDHNVVCDQCHKEGPPYETLLEDLQGWDYAEVFDPGYWVMDVCPRCKAEFPTKDD
jgi:hypothetical protein